jgi:hypothetical protein
MTVAVGAFAANKKHGILTVARNVVTVSELGEVKGYGLQEK